MALTDASFQFLKAAVMAADFTTANVGGAASANLIGGSVLSEVFFPMSATTSLQTQHSKTFFKDNDGTASAYGVKFWIPNALDDVASNGVMSIQSTSASDSSSYYCKGIGRDASGTAQQENVNWNGTTLSTGILTFSALYRAEKYAVAGDVKTAMVGTGTIKVNAVALGAIPAPDNNNSWYSANGEVEIGLEGSLGGATTIATAAAAPAAVSFSKPRTQATGLSAANGGTITAGSTQAIWWRWKLAANCKPSDDVDDGLAYYARTAA